MGQGRYEGEFRAIASRQGDDWFVDGQCKALGEVACPISRPARHQGGEIVEVPLCRPALEEATLFSNVPHVAPIFGQPRMDRRAVDFGGAVVRHHQSGQAVERRCLACAVGSDESQHRARLESQIQRPELEARESLGETLHVYGGRSIRSDFAHHFALFPRTASRLRRISDALNPSAVACDTSVSSASVNRSLAIVFFLPAGIRATQKPLPRREKTRPSRSRSS